MRSEKEDTIFCSKRGKKKTDEGVNVCVGVLKHRVQSTEKYKV